MSDSQADGIYNQLCPTLPEESDEFAGWRRIIAVAISSHVPELEKLLGSQQPNFQFRDDLSQAILICVLTNKVPPKRHSQNRNELKKISEDAAAAEEIIRGLISRLGETSSIYPPIKSRYVELLAKHVPEYASLASMARAHADALTDEGGLTGMIAFRTLIEGLAHVFENVMGYDVSDAAKYRGAKYGYQGLFFEFVQAVLPLVRKLAPDMPCPESRLAEDTFVFKVVTSLRRIGGRRQERRKRPRKVARDKAFRARR
jgi:hypothetical protein